MRTPTEADWPTATTRDYKGARSAEAIAATGRNPMTNTLEDAIQAMERSGPPRTASGPPDRGSDSTRGNPPASWATPQERDYRTSEGNEDRWANPERSRNLNDQTKAVQGSGKLNPSWVETLMGVPMGHTQLPHKFVKPRKGTP